MQIEEILLFTGREYSVPVPDSVKGKTGRLVITFNNLSDEIRLEEFFDPITGHFQKLNQLLFIDNIRFADGGLDVQLPKESFEGDEVTMTAPLFAVKGGNGWTMRIATPARLTLDELPTPGTLETEDVAEVGSVVCPLEAAWRRGAAG